MEHQQYWLSPEKNQQQAKKQALLDTQENSDISRGTVATEKNHSSYLLAEGEGWLQQTDSFVSTSEATLGESPK